MPTHGHDWALILAAGEGSRLRSLTTTNGVAVPKQFCSLNGGPSLLQETLHQFRTLDAHRVGRPVFHVGGGHQLAALFNAGHQHRVQVGACGIDRGAVACRTGAKNQDFGVFGSSHGGFFT